LANGAAYPGIWPQGGIPIVDDFLGNGTRTVLHTGSLNVVGMLTDQGDPLWHMPGSYSQFTPAVLDFTGNGSLDFFLDEAVYSAIDGELLYAQSLPGTPGPAVSADIDGDGRDEAIVTTGSRLFVVGYDPSIVNASVEWSMTFDSSLGMPIVADANGDGQLEIIVVSSSGTVYGIGQPTTSLPSDFDGDGDSDGRDFLAWQRGYGLTNQSDNSNGDADGNGIVDASDLTAWETQFGAVAPSAVTGTNHSVDAIELNADTTEPLLLSVAPMRTQNKTGLLLESPLKPSAQTVHDVAFAHYEHVSPVETNLLFLAEEQTLRRDNDGLRFNMTEDFWMDELQVQLTPSEWVGLTNDLVSTWL